MSACTVEGCTMPAPHDGKLHSFNTVDHARDSRSLLVRIRAREARFDYTRPVRFPARDMTDWAARA